MKNKKTIIIIAIIAGVLVFCCIASLIFSALSKDEPEELSSDVAEVEIVTKPPSSEDSNADMADTPDEVTGDDTEETDEEPTTEPTAEPTQTQTIKREIYEIGDIVELEDQIVVLNKVTKLSNNGLMANFTILNTSNEPISISSLLSFSAKNTDGEQLEQEIFDCGSSSLDGTIVVGDRLTGDICWSGGIPEEGMKLYYSAELFGSPVVFSASSEGEADIQLGDSAIEIDTFAIGELVQFSDHTIVLNSLELSNNKLVANFTIENTGNSEVNVSSLLSFTAKMEDGTKLDSEIFDCGTSSMDGTIIPGDKLKGDICWKFFGAGNAYVHYEAELFGGSIASWKYSEE
jgi:hypothetical protein